MSQSKSPTLIITQRGRLTVAPEKIIAVRNTCPTDLYDAANFCPDESLGYVMKRILVSILHQSNKFLQPHGLTSSQCGLLLHLKTTGRSTVVELARLLHIDAGGTTRLIDRLEGKGYCKRARSSADRRVVSVELTPAGESAIREVPVMLCKVMNAHLAGFSNGDRNSLNLYLLRIAKNAETLCTSD